jgi:hypothetical protein
MVKDQEKESYWEKNASSPPVYPQLGEVSFKSFLKKTGLGVVFSFVPAIIFTVLNDEDFLSTWGLATFLVAGLYFLLAGLRDTSRTSAKKSYKAYERRMKVTQNTSERFVFKLGLFQFGNVQEDIGAAICLLGIGAILLTFAG